MNETALDEMQTSRSIHPLIANELVKFLDRVSTPIARDIAPAFPVVVAGKIDCNDDEVALVDAAYARLRTVLSSRQFKDAVVAASFTETNDLTPDAIYDLSVGKSPIAVDFTMFTGSFKQNHIWHTMGYEDARYPTVCFANRHFIQDPSTCASLILHETMHILGFTHYGRKDTSVPYTMNRIFESVSAQLGV